MRLYLDQTLLMWLRRDNRRNPTWERIAPLLERDGEKIALNLRYGDKKALNQFAVELIFAGRGKTYKLAYVRLAQEIAGFLGQSAVDQLASLVDPPEPKTINMPKSAREKALEKRTARHES